jgi:pimeloyl-ACP methyl ester carboxylesterase
MRPGMRNFASDGVAIAYTVDGEGPPVVLAHALASHTEANWRASGWIDRLVAAGRSVVALDLRGHGRSDRPHEVSAYGAALYGDVARLLDHLGIERADFVGHSLGAWVGLGLLAAHAERIRACALLGCGWQGLDRAHNLFLADALDGGSCQDPSRKWHSEAMLRLSDILGNDRKALAALLRSDWAIPIERVLNNRRPVLLLSGASDSYVPAPEEMRRRIGSSTTRVIPGANHLTVLEHPDAVPAVLAFLSGASCAS